MGNLKQFSRFTLEHDSENPVDKNAIKILRSDGKQVGFLPKGLGKDILKKQSLHYKFKGIYLKETKSRIPTATKILMLEANPETTDRELNDYIDNLNLEKIEKDAILQSEYDF